MTYILLILGIAAAFIVAERLLPGRALPHVPGWYLRVIFLNACQLGIVILAAYTWNHWLLGWSLVSIGGTMPATYRFQLNPEDY